MKRILFAILFILGTALSARSQSTTVSGTVTDTGAQTWNGGDFSFQLIANPNFPNLASYTWTGGALTQTIRGSLNGSGAYSQSLPSNSAISPQGSKWVLIACPLATSSCAASANTTITGATQTLNLTPPVIAINLQSPDQFVRAYADSEIVTAFIGGQYYNLTSGMMRDCTTVVGQACTVWANVGTGAGGGVGGSNTQVQFNDVGAFGGDPTFTFDKTTKVLSASVLSGSFSNIQHSTDVEFPLGTIPRGTTGTIIFIGTPTAFTFTGPSCFTACDGQRLAFFVFTDGAPYSIAGTLGSSVFQIPNNSSVNNVADKLTFPLRGTGAIFEYRNGTLFYVGGMGFIPSFNGAVNAELDVGFLGVSSGKVQLIGATSGSATVGVADIAGTPNRINLPITTGTSGQCLQTNGGNPQQSSWAACGLSFPSGQTPNTNSIYAADPKYGVVGDGKFSNATTIVNTSPTITTGSSDPIFTVADIGKQIFCNADPSGLNGATVLVKSTITGFTSAHVVTASNNATASQANALCLWGTPSQDTAVASFWSDVKTSPTQTCGILPSGIIMVDSSQFTDTSSTRQFGDCLRSGGFTTIVPTPSFNFATCPTATSGCFWHHPSAIAVQQPNSDDIRDIEVWGLGNNLNAFSTTNSIFFFQRATVINVWAWGWGATSSSLTGMQFTGPDQIFESVVYQVKLACGTSNIGGNQTVAFVASYCGGAGGNNLNVSAGAYFVSSQSQFGPNNAGTGVLVAGTLDSTGDVFFGNSTGFTVTVPGTLNIRGGQITAASTGTGLLIQAGGKVNAQTTNINASGGSAVAILRQTTGVYNDLLGNTITAGTFPTIVPACTFTSGGGTSPSCALQTGSTNEKGVIIASTGTGAPGSTGTITLTFAGTVSGTTATAPACSFTLDDSGTAWGNESIVKVSTQSTTAPILAWSNIATAVLTALATSSPYRIDYLCGAR